MTTRDFLQTLFGGCAGFLELRLLPNDGEVSQQFRPLGDGLDWLCKWRPDGRVDVYFGVYPRTRSAGTADAVAPEVSWLFSDLDSSERPFPQALAPTIVVESGTPGHRHLYWRLTQPVGIAQVESLNKALARALGGDLSATDKARVLRLPGTVNSKTNREAAVTHYDPDATYELADFASLMSADILTSPSAAVGGASAVVEAPSLRSTSTDTAQMLRQGERNASLASLAGTMRRRGMSEQAICAALLAENEQRCDPPLSEDEVRRIAHSVARYEPGLAPVPAWRPEGQAEPQTLLPTKGSTVGSEVAGQDRLQGVSLAALRRKAREVGTEVDALPLLGEVEPPIFQRGLSHIIAAPPKAGKTTLLYAQAKEWARAGISILFISEEPEIVWSRRLQAEDAEDEVLERITLLSALGESPDALLDRMSHGSEEIVILDTAKILGVEDENDAATVNRVITPWVVSARETGKTLIVAHHLRKGGGRAVEALAGSYSWAAVFDTVVEIALDEQDSRRQLRAVGRLLPSCKLLYELRGSDLVLLGSPDAVELEATRGRVLEELTGEWMTTAQVHEALGDPRPSLEQMRRALNSLAAGGKVKRHPPWSEGQKQGATYRWRLPGAPTSLPTATSLVGSEVGGADQNALPIAPPTGGQ